MQVRQAVIGRFLRFGAAAVLPGKTTGYKGEEATFQAQAVSSFFIPFVH